MKIRINEKTAVIRKDQTLGDVAHHHKPDADLLIRNGFPAPGETVIEDGDELFLIRRGEIPTKDELEGLMTARHTPGVHAVLKRSTVGIAGVGGLGSAVAVALARVGVGRLIIADFDIVEPSNLNRQQYFIDQIGRHKVDALAENLHRINPYVTVDTHCILLAADNIPALFSPCRIVVEAFDRADMKAMLVNRVLETLPRSTVVAASGMAGFGSNNDIVTRRITERLYLVGDGVSEACPGNGLMAPRVGIAASHQANQVVRILLGAEQ
ncbi:MAG: sulfur carrier protein ThiS adenylyltransferase ThiF [Desulfuromonadaceae bacterium]|nr:sulfur carrier protein ThiS adenylyltransferase ThiF [Desulfuromonadaceae bacterium]MDD5107530.1 sulfur carrier protein ThiS adenylyltransferase ThiF [Desulfuromonadaceae bacterium]